MAIDERAIVEKYLSGKSTVKIGSEYNIRPSNVWSILKRNNIKLRSNKENSRRYYIDEHVFDEIKSEEQAYWLGFIYADGYLSSVDGKRFGMSLAMQDIDHLYKLNKFLHSDYPINIYKQTSGYNEGTDYCRLIVSSDYLYDRLLQLGVEEHKSYHLEYPYYIDDELQRHFIRGFFDGDGCVTPNGNSYTVSFSCLESIKDGIVYMLNKIVKDLKYTYSPRKDNCDNWCLRFSGKSNYEVLKYMYNSSCISLTRKEKKVNTAIEYFSRLYQ